ncbi:HAMP domain-containing histidine kinase [Actinomadura barringtoniae]|uniref:HAMP domain-containing histidine kinase n=1 Tax=Actinomadura barringtoniae TaxID=1427535 RepID=A0A939TGM5_9ACTN|nr:HAMP domain-containing histidine kinase [Actinomadura barringtoniae]MBO2455560.1 HAMP domain-containing histidine kinase [Actinomadura barringtoniae]
MSASDGDSDSNGSVPVIAIAHSGRGQGGDASSRNTWQRFVSYGASRLAAATSAPSGTPDSVRDIVTGLGGTIHVEDGSRFVVRLPRHMNDSEAGRGM